MVKEVIWSRTAAQQLEKVYKYILSDSYQNAQKVKDDILASTNKLPSYPEMYPLDKYRTSNDGSFRAYEIHHYRIAYHVTEKEIIIIRVRHTSMEPLLY